MPKTWTIKFFNEHHEVVAKETFTGLECDLNRHAYRRMVSHGCDRYSLSQPTEVPTPAIDG